MEPFLITVFTDVFFSSHITNSVRILMVTPSNNPNQGKSLTGLTCSWSDNNNNNDDDDRLMAFDPGQPG